MNRRRIFSLGGLLAVTALFLLVNLAADPLLRSARIDLTENRAHTLSGGTVSILRSLETDVTLKLFWSGEAARDLPGLKNYAQSVRDLLEEYASISGGKVRLEVADPRPFSEQEDEALSQGLQGVPVSPGGETVYFGLVGSGAGDTTQVIPFFQPDRERFLEYDVSRLVYSLAHPKRTVVGLLSTLPMDGSPAFPGHMGMSQPLMVLDTLRQEFDLRMISPRSAEPIPDDVDALMVVQPHRLDRNTLYAVDQFVLKGGRALIFADPVSEAAGQQNPASALSEPGPADSLLGAWGVTLDVTRVVGDMDASQRVSYSDGFRTRVVNYLPWISVRGDRINRDEAATLQLGSVNLASAGALAPIEGASTRFIPLLNSTERAMLMEREKVAFAPDPRRILSEFSPGDAPFVLAARLSGPARSAFSPGSSPESEPAGGGEAEHAGSSLSDINVVVVADTDLLQDRFWVDVRNFFGQRIAFPSADNGDLTVNLLDMLGGSPDLIGTRGRATTLRPFELLDRIARQAELKYRAKEQELTASLQETERKLSELQARREDAESPAPTPEQEQEIESFRREKVLIRKELREVQFQLRQDIDRLEAWLRFVNIGMVPLLITLLGVGSWFARRSRSREWRD